jgi:hypothetical protein
VSKISAFWQPARLMPCGPATAAERKAMIDREHELPITRQAQVLRIRCGSVYYLACPVGRDRCQIVWRIERDYWELKH